MITIIICMLIGMLIALISNWYWVDGVFDFIMECIVGGGTGFIIGLIIALALPMSTTINSYPYEIETLQDNSSVSGSFFLGCGDINGTMKYVYYYKINGGFKMGQINYNDAIILYSDKTEIIEHKEELTDDLINLFAIDLCMNTSYDIYVPKGTIKSNYNLDAQ